MDRDVSRDLRIRSTAGQPGRRRSVVTSASGLTAGIDNVAEGYTEPDSYGLTFYAAANSLQTPASLQCVVVVRSLLFVRTQLVRLAFTSWAGELGSEGAVREEIDNGPLGQPWRATSETIQVTLPVDLRTHIRPPFHIAAETICIYQKLIIYMLICRPIPNFVCEKIERSV